MMNTNPTLVSLYNVLALKAQTWQNYVVSASDSLTRTIAMAKVEAYQDAMTTVQNFID
jgi:hypothetical protein